MHLNTIMSRPVSAAHRKKSFTSNIEFAASTIEKTIGWSHISTSELFLRKILKFNSSFQILSFGA